MTTPLVYRILQRHCWSCGFDWRARCRTVGDTVVLPTCPDCGAEPIAAPVRPTLVPTRPALRLIAGGK